MTFSVNLDSVGDMELVDNWYESNYWTIQTPLSELCGLRKGPWTRCHSGNVVLWDGGGTIIGYLLHLPRRSGHAPCRGPALVRDSKSTRFMQMGWKLDS